MICLMHDCEPYGFLADGDTPFDTKTIAKLIHFDVKKLSKMMQELIQKRVIKIDEKGRYFSERMVKDERIRQVRASAGTLGGNPNLVGNLVKQNAKQKSTPSSSSSSSSSSSYSKKELTKVSSQKKPKELIEIFFRDVEQQEKVVQLLAQSGMAKEFAAEQVRAFVDYWTEISKSGNQVRWQAQPFFDLRKRLATWFRNQKGFEKFSFKQPKKTPDFSSN